MSYKINYHHNKRAEETVRRWVVPFTVLLLLLSVVNGVCCLDGNLTGLRERILPWTQPQMRTACSEMIESIAEGEPIGACINTFCQSVLNDAESVS